tara:strand:+ start:33 stop:617 length:585 start_codon:yes stop_codon:yes gene_type:complete
MGFSKEGYTKYNKKVAKFLGMNKSTAMNRLRKMVMFEMMKKLGMDRCYQCKFLIKDVSELSLEHIKPWIWKDKNLFWDMDNIAFSHLACNSSAGQIKTPCGSYAKYLRGCRCRICTHKYRIAKSNQGKRKYKKFIIIKKLAKIRTNEEVKLFIREIKKEHGFTNYNQIIDKLKGTKSEYNRDENRQQRKTNNTK